MSFVFEFEATSGILRCRVEGSISDDSARKLLEAIRRNVADRPIRVGILDLSAVTSFELSSQTVREMARSTPAIPDPTTPRFIIAPSEHVFAMSRMFQMLGETTRPELHILRKLEEAYALLEVTAPKYETQETID